MPTPPRSDTHTVRRKVHALLEEGVYGSKWGRIVDYGIITLVISNIVAFIAGTVNGVAEQWNAQLEAFEIFSVCVFTLEYVLRIWSCVEFPFAQGKAPWQVRLRYATRPLSLIDLLAIAPFYLSFFITIDLRALRIFRLFRLFKLARYSLAMQSLFAVISGERRALFGALLLMACLLLLSATGIYFAEHRAQPDKFGSVPQAMWWAVATLTTVGYGDVVPITLAGKIFGAIVMMFGLGMFALPIGIIATGFSRETSRRDFVITWSLVAKVPMFSKLDASDIAHLVNELSAVTFQKGEVIVRAGDDAHAMYFILSGRVAIEELVEPVTLEQGEFFGEMGLLERRKRSHTVRAETDCRLLRLDAPDFDRLMRDRPDLKETIVRTARERNQ